MEDSSVKDMTPTTRETSRPFRRTKPLAVAAVVCVAALAGIAQEVDPEEAVRGFAYPGSIFLYRMAEVTVVYPAGPGEPVEVNRRSAVDRAAFLTGAHGVRTRVRADDEVSDEEKKGNLLLLGWNNRLCGTDSVPAPFRRTAQGLDFLGVMHREPVADLLFFARSPYDAESFVFFWSRIDPELDRLMVLPWVGSDWAIFQDFLVVRQGMFRPGTAWPPKRDPDAEGDHGIELSRLESQWSTRRTDHYFIRYDPEAISPSEIDAIASAREKAYTRAGAALGGVDNPPTIKLYVYADEDLKKKMTGVADPAHSLPRKRELHMVPRYARAPSPHEEIHLLAHREYGPCYLTALYEGLAVGVDGSYQGLDIDVQAALMLDSGVFPELDRLLDEENGRALGEKIRWPSAGLLVQWLRGIAGERWPEVYMLREGTVEALATALERPSDGLDKSFRDWVRGKADARNADVAFLDAQSEAKERYVAGDFAGVISALARAIELKPDDAQTRFNLASARMRTGDYDGAIADLETLLKTLTDPRSRFVVFGHYQLGRVLDIQGRRDEALAHYRAMLDLPDQHDSHMLAREAIANPVTADQLR
jgi:hypothetical protein